LPSSGQDLQERLARYNIKVLIYDESAQHETLWRGVRAALNRYRAESPKPTPAYPTPMASAHRFLAACYARAAMAPEAAPLRSIISEGATVKSCVWRPDQAASFRTPSTKLIPRMTSAIS
jgi:hypothetical protein